LNEYLIDEQIINICCGKEHTLALSSDGNIYAWGLNGDGQIGMCNDHHYQLIPFRLDSFNERIKAISCGFLHSMTLTESGNVYGWGDNQDGKLGYKKGERFNSPKLIIVNAAIDKISCGFEHSILLSKDGELYVLGYKNWNNRAFEISKTEKFIAIAVTY
jgi:alpha-tubulin suppressor-like RCC1 family protein